MWISMFVAVAMAVDADADGFDEAIDCDDSDPLVSPAGSEGSVVDGIDQDCSGFADDVQVCAVGAPHSSVQAGVDAAPDGFSVRVCPGRFVGRVRLDGRQLSIVGAGMNRTALDGDGVGPVVEVLDSTSGVQIEGLSVINGVTAGEGGGVRCIDSWLTMFEAGVMRNEARTGGGIAADDCVLDVSRVKVTDNEAVAGDGGGLWLEGGEGTLSDALIADNVAEQGGGIATNFSADHQLLRLTVKDNTATSTIDDYVGGGGLFLDGETPLRDSWIVGNHADMSGGGVYINGDAEMTGNTVEANTCDDDGAGVFTERSGGLFANNMVVGNVASDDAGGLRAYNGEHIIEDNVFLNNVASDDGGGVKFSHEKNTFRRNSLIGNSTGDAGGGLELDNDDTDVVDCYFEGNTAGRGGGLHSWDNEGPSTIRDSVFVDNHATGCGGAMAFDNDLFVVDVAHVLVEGNTSDNDGAGLCTDTFVYTNDDGIDEPARAALVKVYNSTFARNVADDEGGGVWVELGEVTLSQVVFAANSAADGDGVLANALGIVDIRNSIFQGHGNSSVLELDDDGDILVDHSMFWEGTVFDDMSSPIGANGNVIGDPLFVDALAGDFHLSGGSPAIDAGDPAVLDLDGSRSDMGLYGGPAGE